MMQSYMVRTTYYAVSLGMEHVSEIVRTGRPYLGRASCGFLLLRVLDAVLPPGHFRCQRTIA